jgi:3-methyladenine DNA glycosylase AlkD
MAGLAVHDTSSHDRSFADPYPLLIAGAADERNYMKKAVSWALRNIGKRSAELNFPAIRVAEQLSGMGLKSARWIGSEALRELTGKIARERLRISERRRARLRLP